MAYAMINTDSEFYEHNFYGLRKHFIKPRFCYRIIYSKIEIQIFDLIFEFSKIDQKPCLNFLKKLFSNEKSKKKFFSADFCEF